MLGHLVYSFNHLDDARIQQEISRKLYAQKFGGVEIVHAHNGKKSFGYSRYLEDVLIRSKNLGHFDGAADLIDTGMKWFLSHPVKGLRYVLITAADTWCLNVKYLDDLLVEMERDCKVIACSSWGRAKPNEKPLGFSTDFLIVDLEWARQAKVFPLDYGEFKKKFADALLMMWSIPTVEACLQYKFARYFFDHFADNSVWMKRDSAWRRLVEREPVHIDGQRQDDWPKIGLYTNPEPKTKQAALRKLKIKFGEHGEHLKSAKNLSYYNQV